MQKISEAPAGADGVPTERIVIDVGDDPRHAAARAGAVRRRHAGAARAVPRGARDDGRADHHRVLRRQGARARAEFPAARRRRCLRRDGLPSRGERLRHPDRRAHQPRAADREAAALVHNLQPEFNDTKHVKGIVSMARGDDPASATTSFFIVTGDGSSLDGKYTAFGRVVDGMAAVDAIEQAPVNGEAPVQRIEVTAVRIVKP